MIKHKSIHKFLPIQSDAKPKNNEELTQKAYLNVVDAMLTFTVQSITSLLISPFLVKGLGNTYYGILQIVQRMSTFMTAADGRPTQALKWTIANQQTSPDHTTKKQDIGSAIAIWLIFSPVLLAVGGILVWLAPTLTKVSTDLYLMVRLTTALSATNILLFGIATLPNAVLRGMNMGYKRMVLTPFFTIMSAILTVIAVLLGFGLPGVAAASVVTSLFTGVVWWGIIRRLLPWFGITRPAPEVLRRFLIFSGWFFCWSLINKVILSGDIVILGMVAGPEDVTIFTLTGYVARMVVGISALVLGSITPGLGVFIGKKRYVEAGAVRHEMLNANWLLCVSIGVSVLLWNKSFIGLWVGKEYYAGDLANLMIMLTVFQLTFIRNDAFIIDLTLNLRRKVLLGGLSTTISLVLAAILVSQLGIVGLCLGLLLGRSIMSIGYPLHIASVLKLHSRTQFKRITRPATATIILFTVSAYLSQYILVNNWLQFLLYATLSFTFAFGVALMVGLNVHERKAIFARMGKVHLFGQA